MTIVQTDRAFVSQRGELADLHLERTDISFHNIDVERVCVTITVHNRGLERSRRTTAVLRAAPLGAFVPWSPLATVMVPEIEPGESVDVSTVVPRPATAPAGFFDDVPPRKLTAVSPADEPSRRRRRSTSSRGGFALISNLLQLLGPLGPRSNEQSTVSASSDVPDLFSDTKFHWAGNVNVLMNNQDVERHMTLALRVHPGVTNLAMFFVGDHRPDEYMFQLKGSGAAWEAALYGSSDLKTLLDRPEPQQALQQSQWLSIDQTRVMLLAFRPPAGCSEAELEVHVVRRSTGRNAIVEFNLDPSAAGTGCYTV